MTTASALLASGWLSLRGGDWAAARTTFQQALEDEETPEALEGLSWAAWWLDDADTVFDARERAYRLYREGDDPSSAARMATWLAADQLDFHGAWPVASGWLQRARRLLEPLDPGPDHGWLAFHEGYIAHGEGDTSRARPLGFEAAEIGRLFDVADLEMLGLALEGAALVASAEVDAGMRCLDEASATALEGNASIPISTAWTCCFLVSACMSVLDHERASAWTDRVAEFAARYGSRYMLAFCRMEYGAVHLWRGRWAEAEELLQAGSDDFSKSRPAWASAPLVGLAELRRRQGRAAEAKELLARAGSSSRAQLCRSALALDADDSRAAVELAERVLRNIPAQRKLDRFPACELLVRARIAAGDLQEARAALDELRQLKGLVGTTALRAHVALAEGMFAAAEQDHGAARPFLEDAVDGFEASGAPFEAARARVELAASLEALGRTAEARKESSAAHDSLDRLGVATDTAPLTPREREVLELLAEGLTNRRIAERLIVSEHTVHRHVTNILRKLDLPSRSAAAAYAVRSGAV